MKKVLSIILSISVLLSLFSITFTANAATDPVVKVKFKGTELNSVVGEAVDLINYNRDTMGLCDIQVDANLTKIAKQRAMDVMIYADLATLPNGNSITTKLPAYGEEDFTGYKPMSNATASQIEDFVSDLVYYADVLSIGMSVFKMADNETVLYAIVSTRSSSSAYYDFSDKTVTASVDTQLSHLNAGIGMNLDKKYLRYNMYVVCNPKEGIATAFILSNDQLKYSSNASSVFKVKGTKAFPKKNGKVKFTAAFNANSNAKINYSLDFKAFKDLRVEKMKAKSPSKKKMKVTWSYSINDIDGYQIQYSTSSKFKNAKSVKVSGKKTTSKTISKLKSKKKYYVRARGYIYQGDGEYFYTAWNTKTSCKVK